MTGVFIKLGIDQFVNQYKIYCLQQKVDDQGCLAKQTYSRIQVPWLEEAIAVDFQADSEAICGMSMHKRRSHLFCTNGIFLIFLKPKAFQSVGRRSCNTFDQLYAQTKSQQNVIVSIKSFYNNVSKSNSYQYV